MALNRTLCFHQFTAPGIFCNSKLGFRRIKLLQLFTTGRKDISFPAKVLGTLVHTPMCLWNIRLKIRGFSYQIPTLQKSVAGIFLVYALAQQTSTIFLPWIAAIHACHRLNRYDLRYEVAPSLMEFWLFEVQKQDMYIHMKLLKLRHKNFMRINLERTRRDTSCMGPLLARSPGLLEIASSSLVEAAKFFGIAGLAKTAKNFKNGYKY